jgi:uncharacterized protein YndB with AHSA1/START domain
MTASTTNYGRITAPAEVRFERLLPGPIETVWEFLTDAKKRGEWLAPGPMELKVGGKVKLYFHHADLSPHKAPAPEKYRAFEDKVHESEHEITQLDPPRLLAMTWPKTSEVIFELKPQGSQVLLTVTHRRLASRAEMVDVSGGWHTHLDILVERANGRTPAAFWAVFGQIDEEYEKRYPKA